MYSVTDHGAMLADKGRTGAYAEALGRAVQQGSVVVDIGTGSGIMALLACRFGARKVYAIEPGEIIQLARQAAAANGYAERIEFIPGISTQVELPEKADVIVAEIHGVLPAFQKSQVSIMDARERFLAPGGCLIPQKETLWAALVCIPEAYEDLVGPWENNGYGFDFQMFRNQALNNLMRPRLIRDHLASEPRCWATVDYRTLSTSSLCGQALWTLDQTTTIHGFALWFDCETIDGVVFSNCPGSRTSMVFGHVVLPWPRSVSLSSGDEVSIGFASTLPVQTIFGPGTPTSRRAPALLARMPHFGSRPFLGPCYPGKDCVNAPAGLYRRSTRAASSTA